MLLTASTSTTSEAHCFSRWYYPTPQHCGWKRTASHPTHWKEARLIPLVPDLVRPEQIKNVAPSFALPDLTVVDWGYADYYGMPVERIRAIALLRALSNVP
jgi:hypothetical protein